MFRSRPSAIVALMRLARHRQAGRPSARSLARSQAADLGAAARAVVVRTPQTLAVVRYRAQPTAATIVRLATTAILAYLLALPLPVTSRPVLAPLTALLVAQVTLYQTVRSAVRRFVAVLAGVLLALGFSALVGFTWWSLGLTIAVALAVGYALHLADTVLEVPISAMLILSVGTAGEAATGRIVETLIGAAAGLISGFVYARPRVQPAADAIADLCQTIAGLLREMAAGLDDATAVDKVWRWLTRARTLGAEVGRVEDALRQAEESVRLNPRGQWLGGFEIELRRRLEELEHAAITVRSLARSLADSAGLATDDSPLRNHDVRIRLGAAVAELASALEAYGRLVLALGTPGYGPVESDLRYHLSLAHERQDQLGDLLGIDPAEQPSGWPLRGEIVSHLDRLRTELEAGSSLSTQLSRPRGLRGSLTGSLRAVRRPDADRAGSSTAQPS
jgi:uncharacterized membrane protein YgaE (UPF0421/DUF939 family)